MKYMTVTEAKKHFLEIVRDADETSERYFITRNGEPVAMLVSADDYEGWLETLEILSDKKSLSEIKKARKELDQGKGIPFEKLLEKLSA